MCNENLKPIKNKFAGKRCFILGTGPSINKTDFTGLENEITIGVNLILKSGFTPNYICVSDGNCLKDNLHEIVNDKMKDGYYILRDDGKAKTLIYKNDYDNIYWLSAVIHTFYGISDDLKKCWITKSFDPAGGVLPDLAIPFAKWLGFSEIYLLGCDGYHGGGDTDHFYKKSDALHHGAKAQIDLTETKNYLNLHGIKLINCTENSAHTEVEYRKLSEVLSDK